MSGIEPSDMPKKPVDMEPHTLEKVKPSKEGKGGVRNLTGTKLKGTAEATANIVIPQAPVAPAPMKVTINPDAKGITDVEVAKAKKDIFGDAPSKNLEDIDKAATQRQLAAARKEFREERGLPDLVEEQVLENKDEEKKDKVGHEHNTKHTLAVLPHSEVKEKEEAESTQEITIPSFSKADEVTFVEKTASQEAVEEKKERDRLNKALEDKKEAIKHDQKLIDQRVENSQS